MRKLLGFDCWATRNGKDQDHQVSSECSKAGGKAKAGNVRRNIRQVLVASFLFLIGGSSASADILFTTGAMTPITTPVDFAIDASESSTSISILDEGVTVLPVDVLVNAFGIGVHDASAPPYLTIPVGTTVHSYIVHFDPLGSSFATLSGSVFFDPGEIILGVQTHTPLLYATDALLGNPAATYPAGFIEFRAFESLPGTDTVTLPPGMGSAAFTLYAELGIDQARIITLVPEPGSILMLLSGIMLFGRRFQRRSGGFPPVAN